MVADVNQKPTVDIVLGRYNPPNFKGGIENYIYYLNRYLIDREYKVRIFAMKDSLEYTDEFQNIVKLRVLKIPIILTLLFQLRFMKYLKNTNIVILNYPTYGVLLLRKIKFIPILHTLASEEGQYLDRKSVNLNFFKYLYAKNIIKLFEKITFTKARHIICLNGALKKSIVDMGFPDASITVIPNGIDTKIFTFVEPREFNKNTRVRFLYVGRLVSRKNISILLQSILNLSRTDFELSIVGTGEEEKKIRKIILGKSQVRFLGYKSGAELRKEYHNCDMYILPSFYEGLPFTVLESQACGKPGIIGNFSDADKIIKDGYNGFIVKNNTVKDFTEVINYVLDNKLKIKEMSYNSREFVREHFSNTRCFEETERTILRFT